jgi:hypothetical protein
MRGSKRGSGGGSRIRTSIRDRDAPRPPVCFDWRSCSTGPLQFLATCVCCHRDRNEQGSGGSDSVKDEFAGLAVGLESKAEGTLAGGMLKLAE